MKLDHNCDINWKVITLVMCMIPFAALAVILFGIIGCFVCPILWVIKKVKTKKVVDIP